MVLSNLSFKPFKPFNHHVLLQKVFNNTGFKCFLRINFVVLTYWAFVGDMEEEGRKKILY